MAYPPAEQPKAQTEGAPDKGKKTSKGRWHTKIAACRKKREKLNKTWQVNVDFRKNKVYAATDETQDRIAVPVDWARTKNKIAQLFFQVPAIKAKARRPEFVGAAALYAAAVTFELEHEIRAHHLMDECLSDAVNAAGMGIALIGYDASFEEVTTPAIDLSVRTPAEIEAMQQPPAPPAAPAAAPAPPADGMEPPAAAPVAPPTTGIPQMDAKRTVYQCYYGRRISPSQFLWPPDFTGSDWQKAEWLGYEDRIPLAEALRRKWVDDDYEAEMGDKLESMSSSEDQDPDSEPVGKYVKFSQIFYKKSVLDPEEKDPRKLGMVVMIDGKKEPVVDEDFRWQAYDAQTRTWGGLTSFPLKVLTLVYVSDEDVPPSDSEIGRPQVKELNKSRTQMLQQRDRSAPMRWFDVNMVDEAIADQMEHGTYQGMIPMNGPGNNAIGEVARANYPRETFQFQQIIEKDLDSGWSMGPDQLGYAMGGDTSAAEANHIANAASVRLDYERAKVLRFFLDIAEGVGSLLQLFQDDEKWVELEGPDGLKQLQAWNNSKVRGDYAFEAKPDAAIKIDVGQKRVESLNVYKLLRRDPLANGQEILKDVLEWHGFDLSKAMVPPAPPPPKPATLRYTFKGEDLTNPVVVALVQANSEKPLTPQDLAAAKKLMSDAGIPVMAPQVMPVPQPNQHGQLPTVEQVAAGKAKHPGPPEQVDPLGQRYGNGPSEAADGGGA